MTIPLAPNTTMYAGSGSVPLMPRRSLSERPQVIGIAALFGLLCTTLIDINGLISRVLHISEAASILILLFCLTLMVSFQFRFLKSTGPPGTMYLLLIGYYFIACTLIRLADPSVETIATLKFALRMNMTSPIILFSVALGMRHLCASTSLERGLFILFWIAMIQVPAVLLDVAFGEQLFGVHFSKGNRASGFFANPNAAGFGLASAAVVGFACLVLGKKKLLTVLSLASCGLAVIFTFSRSSIIAMFVVGLVQPFVSPIFKRKSVMVAMAVLFVGVGWFVTVGAQSYLSLNRDQEQRLGSLTDILKGDIDEKKTGHRFVVAANGIRFWLESPVFGHGLGMGGGRHPDYIERFGPVGPHNQYVFTLMEGGLPLFGLYVSFLFSLAWAGWKSPFPAVRTLLVGYAALLAANSMTSHNILENNSHSALLGAAMGGRGSITRS